MEHALEERAGHDVREIHRWQGHVLWAWVGAATVGIVWPLGGAVLILLPLGALAILLYRLYHLAATHGGRRYAATHTILAAVLAPFLVGIVLVPRLVISDVEKGVAAYRRATATSLGERLLDSLIWIGVGFGSLLLGYHYLGGWGIPVGLLVGLPLARWLRDLMLGA